MVHPTPYSLQWLKQGSEVIISKQALITFLVGPYYGEVQCNVLPMDTCHFLLGNHHHVIHNGHATT